MAKNTNGMKIMKKLHKKSTIFIFLIIIMCLSCSTVPLERLSEKDIEVIHEELFEKKLASPLYSETYFKIFLPESYLIETSEAEDFSVFYINDNETTIGGIYLGNHPSQSIEENNDEYVLHKKIESKIMMKRSIWNIYSNSRDYFTEIVIKNNRNEGWNQLIHLWIKGDSIEDIRKHILLFSTLNNI
jgi:hypothetical protein